MGVIEMYVACWYEGFWVGEGDIVDGSEDQGVKGGAIFLRLSTG